jgi:hypothetical protein
MYELYGQNLISGFEFTVKISDSRSELQSLLNKLNNQSNVIYFIV